jgi:hypothetical protein
MGGDEDRGLRVGPCVGGRLRSSGLRSRPGQGGRLDAPELRFIPVGRHPASAFLAWVVGPAVGGRSRQTLATGPGTGLPDEETKEVRRGRDRAPLEAQEEHDDHS